MITMKKLALAVTAALGISALAAGPATALSLDAAPSGSAPTDESHSSESGAAEEEGSEDDLKSHDEDLALRYATMTLYEVAHGKGIEYTVDGLKAGDVVTTSLNDKKSVVKKDGPFDGSVVVDEEPDVPTALPFMVYVERDGERVREMSTSVDLMAEGDRGEYDDGTLLMNPEEDTNDTALGTDGVNLTMVNCSAEDEVVFRVFKKNTDGQTKVWEKRQLAGEDESASVRYIADSSKDLWGKYVITAECGGLEDSAPLQVYIDE